MSAVAIIPARGGSKRIPRKNIKHFHGLPMIAYSIKVALESRLFSDVVVSTDDEEIAAVAKQYGANVPFIRPEDLSDDYATTLDVMEHAADFVLTNYSDVRYLCCIYATAPMLKADYLTESFGMISKKRAGYVFAGCKYDFPIQRALYIEEGGCVQMFYPDNFSTRSQDLTQAYHDAGQFYWGRLENFINKEMIFSSSSSLYELPSDVVQDIDTPKDWKKAEAKYALLSC